MGEAFAFMIILFMILKGGEWLFKDVLVPSIQFLNYFPVRNIGLKVGQIWTDGMVYYTIKEINGNDIKTHFWEGPRHVGWAPDTGERDWTVAEFNEHREKWRFYLAHEIPYYLEK